MERLKKDEVGADPGGRLLSLAEQLLAGKVNTEPGSEEAKEEPEDDLVDELTDFDSEDEGEGDHRGAATSAALLPFARPAPDPSPTLAPLFVGGSVAARWPSHVDWEDGTGKETWFRRSELVDYLTEGGQHIMELQQQVLYNMYNMTTATWGGYCCHPCKGHKKTQLLFHHLNQAQVTNPRIYSLTYHAIFCCL